MPNASPRKHRKSAAPAESKAKRARRTLTRYERIFLERLVACGGLEAVSQVFAQSNKGGPPAYSPEECQRLFALPLVQSEYKKRLEIEAEENARQMVRAKLLHDPSFLDAQAVDNIERAEPGSKKTRALELGYTVAGVLAKNELALKPKDPGAAPAIYRALQTTTVQRVTETITQTKEIASPEPKALPASGDSEVLEY